MIYQPSFEQSDWSIHGRTVIKVHVYVHKKGSTELVLILTSNICMNMHSTSDSLALDRLGNDMQMEWICVIELVYKHISFSRLAIFKSVTEISQDANFIDIFSLYVGPMVQPWSTCLLDYGK